MSSTSKARRRWGAAAVVPAVALMTAGVASAGASGTATAAPATGSQGASAVDYINYVAPRAEKASVKDVKLTKDAKRNKAVVDAIERATQVDAKHAGGNPVAARQLAKLEAKAIKGKTSPKHIKSQYKNAKTTQTAKLLTILVDFNEAAGDDFTDVQVPEFWGAAKCKPGSVQNGPLHNNIPDPATQTPQDNNSMWVPDFSSAHYNAMLYTKTGLTQRVRTDLTGPDGKPGFDLSGYTMKNMYEEMSKGAYTVTGAATPWVKVPHSEAYYGASTCSQNANGQWEAGEVQDMQGHPDNPLGAGQLPIDAVAALAAAQPGFPWADYDVEDQGDVDGDTNFNEPDGVIDHVVLVHAGEDKSSGGGAESTYSIWAHSSAVPGGAPVPGRS
jgi:immune inhibitor A